MPAPTKAEQIEAACSMAFDILSNTEPGDQRDALVKMQTLCDALEASVETPHATNKLSELRHWADVTYGGPLTGYTPQTIRAILGSAIAGVKLAAQRRL